MADKDKDTSGITEEEIEAHLDTLVSKGYLECEVVNGEKRYQVTELGKAFFETKKHAGSDPKDQN